jgi:hypothetical protein
LTFHTVAYGTGYNLWREPGDFVANELTGTAY